MARTFTTPQRSAVAGARLACFGKLEVTDPDGTWRDVGALGAADWFNEATISDNIDANTLSFSAMLAREVGNLSLSPYRSDSTINRNALAAYAPMLDVHRYWRVSAAVLAAGSTPVSGDWREVGKGIVDVIDVQEPTNTIAIAGRGMEADLLDAFVSVKRGYGSDSAPIAMETVIQSMLDDNLGAGVVTLVTPVSPLFVMRAWLQDFGNLMGALTTVADKAAFILRYRYDAADALNFTLYKPNRNPVAVDWTIAATEYLALPSVKIDLSGVRNCIELTYVDPAAGLTTVRSPVSGTSSSITKYGKRYMAIDLSGNTQVTSNAQAQAMVDAVRSDLELPAIEQMFETFGFWFVQIGDYGQFTANGRQYDADQFGGVQSYTHHFANGTLRTQVAVRGKPAGRYRAYLDLGAPETITQLLGELGNVQWSVSGGVTVVTFQRNSSTNSVWAAAALAPIAQSPDWGPIAAGVAPLGAGATSFIVPTPADGQATLVQLEPRHADLSVGTVRRLIITATPQLPVYSPDDHESPTVGTQYIQFIERGIPIVSVEVQTQVGTSPASSFGLPTRGPGAASTVKGGVLGPLAYEHDVPLDSSRQSWVIFRYTLANGYQIPIIPFGFDRDKLPNLGPVTVDPSTGNKLVTIVGDVDTKSVGLYAKSPGTWKYEVDGTFAKDIDVTKPGTNGVAGLAAATAGVFTAKALGDPVIAIGGSTLSDQRDVTVLNGGAAPAAGWDIFTLSAPPSSPSGSTNVTIALKASSAPVGWTVKIYLDEGLTSAVVPTTDRTASLTPAAGAVPTVLTTYAYTSAFPYATGAGRYVTLRARAELLDNTGAAQASLTLQANWYS